MFLELGFPFNPSIVNLLNPVSILHLPRDDHLGRDLVELPLEREVVAVAPLLPDRVPGAGDLDRKSELARRELASSYTRRR